MDATIVKPTEMIPDPHVMNQSGHQGRILIVIGYPG